MLENEMIKIPEGKIILNDDRKKEKWEVKINSFLLNKFPVTQELYHSITNLNPSTFKGKFKPVETVSWKDAQISAIISSVSVSCL